MNKMVLSPLNIPFENCFEAVLANSAHWLGRDYQLMYLDEWDFDCGDWRQTGSFGAALDTYKNKVQPLKNYHGVLYHEQQGGFDDLRAYMEQLLPDKPVVVRLDSFYCPWDKSYGRHHNDWHTVCISGFDNEKETVLMTDPFYHLEGIRFDCGKFSETFRGWYGCCDLVPFELPPAGPPGLLRERLKALFERDVFGSMERFADDFDRSAVVSFETTGYDECWRTPLFQNIKALASSRARLIPLASYVYRRSGRDTAVVEHSLTPIVSGWMRIKDASLKYLIAGSERTQKGFSDSLRLMAKAEEEAAGVLLRELGG